MLNSFIDWKQHDDPASYTESDLDDQEGYSVRPRFAWFDEHQGQVWWDLSAVRYYDYYQGSAREKAFQWGKQFPGSIVQIYEWVKSVVPPAQWVESSRTGFLVDFESVTGTPYNKIVNGEPKYFLERARRKRQERCDTHILLFLGSWHGSYIQPKNKHPVSVGQGTRKLVGTGIHSCYCWHSVNSKQI